MGFSFLGLGRSSSSPALSHTAPELHMESDREVYRPGDPLGLTIRIRNPTPTCSLLIDRLTLEIKGIQRLDTQWFNLPTPPKPQQQHRGDYLFMDASAPFMVSNHIVPSNTTTKYVVRTLLPTTLPPSYKGATLRYMYYVRSTLSGKYIDLENGHSHEEAIHELSGLEIRIPLQIWVTQNNNGLQSEGGPDEGIVPTTPALLDVYWKHMDGDSEWIRANETFDGAEEGYDSSRDEISSVSSYNPTIDDLQRSFGSSLSLQSLAARSSNKDSPQLEGGRGSTPSFRAALPRLSVAEITHDSRGDIQSPSKTSAIASSTPFLHRAKSLSTDDEAITPLVPGSVESGASEGFARGRSYNIRLDDQVLLRFSPKNSDSTYYFSDMIGGTLTFFHEEGTRRCLELSISLEMTETINRRVVHPSRRHSPTITKVHSDHQEVVADLVQTGFMFSIPIDGPMSFATRYVSVQWALRFEFFTTPKNVDWTRYEHPLLVEGRDKCEWVLPISVHAPPTKTAPPQNRSDKPSSLEPLWVRT